MLLPHNEDDAKPRALNTFLDGLAELRVNKRLIKNKNKILNDLLEKERGYQDKEEGSGNEANDENLWDSSEEEETSSEYSQPEESHNSDLESNWEEEAENSSDSVENSTITQAKVHDPCRHCNS